MYDLIYLEKQLQNYLHSAELSIIRAIDKEQGKQGVLKWYVKNFSDIADVMPAIAVSNCISRMRLTLVDFLREHENVNLENLFNDKQFLSYHEQVCQYYLKYILSEKPEFKALRVLKSFNVWRLSYLEIVAKIPKGTLYHAVDRRRDLTPEAGVKLMQFFNKLNSFIC